MTDHPDHFDTKEEYEQRQARRAQELERMRQEDPTIGLNLEGQRRSTNFEEYSPTLWDQIVDFFNIPQKEIKPENSFWVPENYLNAPNGFSEDQLFFMRKLLGFVSEEALENESPEIRRLHRLRTNPETFEGYLYDLDSRGIRVQSQQTENGIEFSLRINTLDSFGNRIPPEQLRETELLLRQREPEVYARSEDLLYSRSDDLLGGPIQTPASRRP